MNCAIPPVDRPPYPASFYLMITLTDQAVSAVRKLAQERAQPGQHLRVFIQSGGCSGFEYGMGFAEPLPEDHVIEQEDLKILIDPKSLDRLSGCRIDFDDGLSGKGFEIQNPNAESTCGCGKSFA